MKYFIDKKSVQESHTTCYFEFQKGSFKNKCCDEDSIFIRDSLWDEYNLSVLIEKFVPDFDYYGTTEINFDRWNRIVKFCESNSERWNCIIFDSRDWADECFKQYNCFTIVGM